MSGDVWDDVVAMEEPTRPIDDVGVNLTVVLGQTTMPIHELLRLGRGAVIALDTTEEDDVRILVGEMEVAVGQLHLNGERIEVNVTNATLRDASYRAPSEPFTQAPKLTDGSDWSTTDEMDENDTENSDVDELDSTES